MEVNIYDADLNRLGVVDEIDTLIWTRRYWACGEFSMLLPVTARHLQLLQIGRLVIPQGYTEAAEILYVHISTDTNGQEQIEVQGKFLPWWIGKRVMLNQIVTTEPPETIMHRIVADNVVSPADPARAIPQLTQTGPETTGTAIEYASEENANALDELEAVAGSTEIGFRVVSRPRERTHTFETYAGRDLTARNSAGNDPCIFSRDFDNVLTQEYTKSSENARNMAYVAGEEREDDTRMVVEVGAENSGLNRSEVYISASDISQSYEDDSGTEITMTDAEYEALLVQRGESDLSEHVEAEEFDSQINPGANLIYREDFDLGDRVTVVAKEWGVTKDTRITEVQETYQKGAERIQIVFGEPLPTLSDRLKQIKKEG